MATIFQVSSNSGFVSLPGCAIEFLAGRALSTQVLSGQALSSKSPRHVLSEPATSAALLVYACGVAKVLECKTRALIDAHVIEHARHSIPFPQFTQWFDLGRGRQNHKNSKSRAGQTYLFLLIRNLLQLCQPGTIIILAAKVTWYCDCNLDPS